MRIINKFIATVISTALVCTCMPTQEIGTTNVFAEEEVTEEFTIDENGVLQKYSGAGGDVVIPEGVTSIGSSAFYGCSGLTSITIPEGVTSIGSGAFYGCNSLISITIPEDVTEIGGSAFGDTKWLKEKQKENSLVIVNNIVIDGSSCVGDVVIPEGVVKISNDAFVSSGLISVIIPESVTEIGDHAFFRCSDLLNITIPLGVTSIGGNAFLGTKWLKEKQKENPLVIINNIVIDGKICVGDVIISEEVTKISSMAFYSCSDLTSILIPESVTSIGYAAFDNCSSFTAIKGKKGSYAEEYANEYGYEFVAIEGDNTFIMGDLDKDGLVNLIDATILLRGAVGIITFTDEQKKAADINNDGKINLNDATMVLRAAVGIAN